MAEGQQGRYGRPTRQANLGAQRMGAAPRLVVTKQELARLVAKGVAEATAEALERERERQRKRELRRSKRLARCGPGPL